MKPATTSVIHISGVAQSEFLILNYHFATWLSTRDQSVKPCMSLGFFNYYLILRSVPAHSQTYVIVIQML